MTKALIVACKTELNLEKFNNDKYFIIGVERGCLDLISKNIKIDLAISDFDNVTKKEVKFIKQNSKEFNHLNFQKNHIDGEIAIIEAIKKNINEITFIVDPTKRFDMNITIYWLINKYNIKVWNSNSILFKLNKGSNKLLFNQYEDYTFVSFITFKRNKVTIEGLFYEVKDFVINPFEINAISNCFKPSVDGLITCEEELICIMTK